MIVEDSLLLRNRLVELIQGIDDSLKIVLSETANAALSKFKSEKPEVIILDIALPDMSGIEVLKTVKETIPETKVIIFTNYSNGQIKEMCLKLGADYFLSKSDEFEKLASVILEIIRKN